MVFRVEGHGMLGTRVLACLNRNTNIQYMILKR